MKKITNISLLLLFISCGNIFARVKPADYELNSFEACYQRVLEIWRQIPLLVDEDKLEAIGIIKHVYTNYPDRCMQELEPGDGYPAKAVLQYWIARYKEKAEWWGQAIPEYEKALEYLQIYNNKINTQYSTRNVQFSSGIFAVPTWIVPIKRRARKINKSDTCTNNCKITNHRYKIQNNFNPKWVVWIVRGLARSYAHLDQEKMADRYWNLAWEITPHCPKLLSEYNCWRAEFLYRRAAPNRVEVYETEQYELTNAVLKGKEIESYSSPLLEEAERLCREVFDIYPKPNRRLYHLLGQILYASGNKKKQNEAIEIWLEGLENHGVIPRFAEMEWLIKDLQKSIPKMTDLQLKTYIKILGKTIKRIPATNANVPAIAYLMNQKKMIEK